MKITRKDEGTTYLLKNLRPGTTVTGLKSNPGSTYIKIDKEKSKYRSNFDFNWEPHHCLLLNVKYGTIRAVCADEKVVVLDAELFVEKAQCMEYYLRTNLREE